ncbi:MAG: Flp family type IVb pilin [Actinomycetes bacterium]
MNGMEKLQQKLLDCYVRFNNEDGQGMVEYALILFLISVVSLAILAAIGVDVKGAYNSVEDAINGSQAT